MQLPPHFPADMNQIWPSYVWNMGRLADGLANIGDPALREEMRGLGVIPAAVAFVNDPDVEPTLARCAQHPPLPPSLPRSLVYQSRPPCTGRFSFIYVYAWREAWALHPRHLYGLRRKTLIRPS